MPPVQTTYAMGIAAAVAGLIANMEMKNIISRNVESAGSIEFGVPVARGATDDGCIPFVTGGKFLGIVALDRSVRASTPNGFGQYESARILTKGVIWVKAEVAVVAGEPVTLTAAGKFSNTGGTAIPAVWDSSVGIGGLAKVRLG